MYIITQFILTVTTVPLRFTITFVSKSVFHPSGTMKCDGNVGQMIRPKKFLATCKSWDISENTHLYIQTKVHRKEQTHSAYFNIKFVKIE